MQVSADNYGYAGLREAIERFEHGETLPMNVSEEADAAFMSELERTDPHRYANLIRNMCRAAKAEALRAESQQAAEPETSQRVGRSRKYQTSAARQRAYRRR